MRPAYETVIEALKKDLNRIEDYSWERIVERLMHIATAPERLYLEEEIKKIRYEYAAVQLGRLVLGVRDDNEDEAVNLGSRMTRNLGLGRGAARQFTPMIYESSTPIPEEPNPNPNQMELDL